MNKRLLKEIQRLTIEQNSKPLLENDYLVYMNDNNINKVYTIIKPPNDSVYRHKFIRLNFDIPKEYPYHPPTVTFVNYDNVRIHPNFYEDGKCCSTILNSWPSIESDGIKLEAWSSSMGIETVLLTFRSFLDNNPYTHEPGGRDDITYTDYVLHQTWETCLFKYLRCPYPEIFLQYINQYLFTNIDTIFNDLYTLNETYPVGLYHTPCFYIYEFYVNYNRIINYLHDYLLSIDFIDTDTNVDTDVDTEINNLGTDNNSNSSNTSNNTINNETNRNTINNVEDENKTISFLQEIQNTDEETLNNKCNICFDDLNSQHNKTITLECNHSFHINCIKRHILYNGQLCSFCRSKTHVNETVINPETNREIKIDGATYKKLLKKGHDI